MVRNMLVAGLAAIGLSFGFASIEQADAAERAEPGVIEEIVVTSRRREESVQDVPLSVTAFGEEALERFKPTTFRDFDGMAPNMYMTESAAGPSVAGIFIRGIGYSGIEKTNSPQVGMIVDGLQMGSTTGALIDMFDVESLEINRGPQGVLFGKNTLGGNIVVNRVRPQFNDLGVKVSAEVGNHSITQFKGRVNIPLASDTLALKLGFVERERDGYWDNLNLGGTAGDIDFSSQTAALRFAPNENIDAILTYDRIRDDSDTNPQDPRYNGDDPFETLADKDQPTTYDVDQLGLRLDWDLNESWTLNSITGWHDGHDLVNQDFDSGGIDGAAVPFAQLHTLRDQDFEVFTQELRISGDINEKFSVMAGVYYFDSELRFNQDTNNVLQLPPVAIDADFAGFTCGEINDAIEAGLGIPGGLGLRANPGLGDVLCQFPSARSTQIASEDVESWAYFGSVTWRPTPELELTFGARYIDEKKDGFNSYFDYTDGTFDDRSVPGYDEFNFAGRPEREGVTYSIKDSWDDVIITASANWAFTDNNRAYATYSEGFRSGGFSIRSARDPAEAAYEPEDGWQIEVGLKNDFLNGALRANLAYFFLERDGAQFNSIISLPPGSIPGTTTLVNNGGTTQIQGVEGDLQWLINDNFTLSLNGGFIDVENKEFTIPCELLDGCTSGGVIGADPEGTLRTLGGNSDAASPDWTVNIMLAYDKQIGPGVFSANVGFRTNGEFVLVNTGGGQDQKIVEGNNDNLDARIAYEWQMQNGDSLTLSAYGKNLTDEEWLQSALFLGGFRTGFQSWAAPRTYAFEVTYRH